MTSLPRSSLLALVLVLVAMSPRVPAQQRQAPAPDAKPSSGTWNDPEYLRWLEERSMLYQARQAARAVSGRGVQWRHPYGEPQPREAVQARLGLAARLPRLGHHPAGQVGPRHLGRPGAVGRPPRHRHRPAAHRAGQPRRRRRGPRVHADASTAGSTASRWSSTPQLGTEEEYAPHGRGRRPSAAASIAGDLVPLHTGTGRRLPPGRSGPTRTTPACTRWSRSPARTGACCRRSTAPGRRARVPKDGGRAADAEGLHPRPDQLQRRRRRRPASWSGWSATGEVRRRRRQGPPLGLPALLQAGPAGAQLARPVLRRPAGRRRRRGPDGPRPRRPRRPARRRAVPRHRAEAGQPPRRCTTSTRCRSSATNYAGVPDPQAGRLELPRAERAAGGAEAVHRATGRTCPTTSSPAPSACTPC